eukprot:3837496-Prymnesium_polylepis.1
MARALLSRAQWLARVTARGMTSVVSLALSAWTSYQNGFSTHRSSRPAFLNAAFQPTTRASVCKRLQAWEDRGVVNRGAGHKDIAKKNNEQWPVCYDRPLGGDGGDCLVYSFGIAGDFHFDDMMARRGCEVHSFDPTEATMALHMSHTEKNVHFHGWGLASELPLRCQRAGRRVGGL